MIRLSSPTPTAIVSAAQMQAIESRLFEGGMPIAALMEKAGLRLAERIAALFPLSRGYRTISILVGPGHNGGDALVVGRELWEKGYCVKLLRPFAKAKALTEKHAAYAEHLGVSNTDEQNWFKTDVIVDGLFGFGLTRLIEGDVAVLIDRINQSEIPVVSLDLPSGIHTDTGEVLGVAIQAQHTLCLGLWKRACFQEQALDFMGRAALIPLGLPESDQVAILGTQSPSQIMSSLHCQALFERLERQRSITVHKYQVGATLLICGSAQYPGAAILAAKAARATGVGMLFVAMPQSLKNVFVAQVPDAIAIACPETVNGAIAKLPDDINLHQVRSVAIGPGLTLEASRALNQCLSWDLPLILDADALNILATQVWQPLVSQRSCATVLTPHWGEFKRLFPDAVTSELGQTGDRLSLLSELSSQSQATIVLKGAKTLISEPQGALRVNASSTSALARGGSGDVLTGMIAGLMAQSPTESTEAIASAAVWWHAQTAIMLQEALTSAGVHPQALIDALCPYRQRLRDGKTT